MSNQLLKTHKDLEVWKRSIGLSIRIYKITKIFPKEELYSLTSQIRRSSVSVPSNIAEGAARKSSKDFLKFLYISLGSLSELETQCVIADTLEFFDDKQIFIEIEEIRKMLIGLIKSIERNNI